MLYFISCYMYMYFSLKTVSSFQDYILSINCFFSIVTVTHVQICSNGTGNI